MSTHQHDQGHPRPEAPEQTGHPHEAQAPQVDPDADPRAFWEGRYGGDRVWSGKVNATTAALVAGLDVAPGRALDLGCGEGGDVLHLAEVGWDVTGIDLSEAAVARARDAARERGVAQRTRFLAADLSDAAADWGAHEAGAAGYDLVTASFLQSPVALDRRRILHRAADSLAPGGTSCSSRTALRRRGRRRSWPSGATSPPPPPSWPPWACRPRGTRGGRS